MSRYIDADKLTFSRVRIIHPDGTAGGWNAVVMSSVINNAPTADVVEVVRCKDCVHSCECELPMVPKEVLWCNKLVSLAHEKHFCSYGERREG